jgi:hypothetical protein
MKRIVVALSALTFVLGAGATLSQVPAHADEAKVEEAYKPPKDEPELNEVQQQKKIARIARKKDMKAKTRRLRRGNHAAAGGYSAAPCSNQNCR